TQSDWSLYDFVDRLYSRLRNRRSAIPDLDRAVEAGINSLLHEEARNRERRRMRVESLDAQPAAAIPSPSGLQFVTALVCRDRLNSFIELLDPWTRKAFHAVHIDCDDVPQAVVARRFGMKANSFNKRFQRGIEKAKEKYLALYGPP